MQVVTATKDDTLTDIARRFNVGYEEILRANPKVDPWLPGEGREIIVPTQFILPDAPRTGVVINIAAMRIFYYPPVKRGEPAVVITHPIGIGKVGWRTPEGVTKIVRRQKDPTWRVPVSVRKEHHENGEDLDPVIGPGPDNPLGKYAFYLQWPSYLIHGTNKPAGVGLRSSHGCIRLYPEDIEQFFNMVPVGTQVRVVNQPFVFGWHDGQLYMQPFDVLEDDTRDWKKAQKKLLTASLAARLQQQLKSQREQVDWNLVSSLTQRRAACRCRSPRPGRASSRSWRRRRACRTCCPRAPPGTASPICRWMRLPSSRCSRRSSRTRRAIPAAPAPPLPLRPPHRPRAPGRRRRPRRTAAEERAVAGADRVAAADARGDRTQARGAGARARRAARA